jgi:uracil phosphoribosyltransferase
MLNLDEMENVHIVDEEFPIIGELIRNIRDKNIQQDRNNFRININEIAYMIGMKISQSLVYREIDIETPLGTAK